MASPMAAGRQKQPVPCPYCAVPFDDAPLMQQHLVADHGHKQKAPKKVKVKLKKAKYKPQEYNPAKGFISVMILGIVVVCGLAVWNPGSIRYAVPVGSLLILAARYGMFNK